MMISGVEPLHSVCEEACRPVTVLCGSVQQIVIFYVLYVSQLK
jgi:hypothetical protein